MQIKTHRTGGHFLFNHLYFEKNEIKSPCDNFHSDNLIHITASSSGISSQAPLCSLSHGRDQIKSLYENCHAYTSHSISLFPSWAHSKDNDELASLNMTQALSA